MLVRRRDFLRSTALSAGVLALGPAYWRGALAQTPAIPGAGPYGPLGAPDANGLALPAGFSARVLAQALLPVAGTGYLWPLFPDGSATYATPDGGWVLVVNSEVPGGMGGASMVRFDKGGAVTAAGRILDGTSTNCGGGATPWGTWLSGEEVDDPGGLIWECDPLGEKAAVPRPALGRFKHEAAAVDPVGKRVYLSEDLGDGALYRFTPATWPDLGAGLLELATAGSGGRVAWVAVPDPGAASAPTRTQVPGAIKFARGEGIFFDSGIVYLATTSDDRIHAYDTETERLDVLYDGKAVKDAPLHRVDNLTAHPRSGDLFVCEDADDLQICLITADREVAPFLQLSGPAAGGPDDLQSETTGVTFDPSGTRLYFSSQRALGGGITYEVSGPFRTLDPRRPPRPVAVAVPVARKPLRVRAKASVALSTVRSKGVLVTLDADRAGTYTVRLVVAGRTVARRTKALRAAGTFRLRLRARTLRFTGRRARATVVVTQGKRRVTRGLTLTRGG